MKTVIGITAALILFSSLFTNGGFAESDVNQNKSKAGDDKKLSREENAAQLALKYPNLYKDPHKADKPPIPKVQEKTKFKTSDGVKLLTKGQGAKKKAKTGIRTRK
ncbi:MAG TPA: hypothetical protein VLF17_02530 [Candidatus Nitrosotenuis sp.]|nr:hypothetical protein [Candidatus Nitrosotenuis sp.]